MKPVLYRYKDTESVVRAMDGYVPAEGWVPLFDEAAIKAATNAALERAAEVCDVHAEGWEKNPGANPLAGYIAASNCALAIRALKDKP